MAKEHNWVAIPKEERGSLKILGLSLGWPGSYDLFFFLTSYCDQKVTVLLLANSGYIPTYRDERDQLHQDYVN